jgi:hypothetical protein
MEAFFRMDQEIQEWIDLFIEKLFTVSLLSGMEADSEYYRGRQAVEKIASFLQEIADLPNEALRDGIHQLVEQRLPDSRVIENFPNFYNLMNEMIQAALVNPPIIRDTLSTKQENIPPDQISPPSESVDILVPSSKIILNGGRNPASPTQDFTSPISLREHLINPIEFITNPEPETQNNSAESANQFFSDSLVEDSPNVKTDEARHEDVTVIREETIVSAEKDISKSVNPVMEKNDPIYETGSNRIEILNETNTFFDLSLNTGKTEIKIKNLAEAKNDIDNINHEVKSDINSNLILNNFDKFTVAKKNAELPKNPFKITSILKSALYSSPLTIKSSEKQLKPEFSNTPNGVTLKNEKVFNLGDEEQEPLAQSAMANISFLNSKRDDALHRAERPRDPFRFNTKKAKPDTLSILPSPMPKEQQPLIAKVDQHSASRVVKTAQMPEDGLRLSQVLKHLFPNSAIRWNVTIDNTTFYAQIEKLLVYIPLTADLRLNSFWDIKNDFNKQGWCVYICNKEDLAFPRRLEREIRFALR